MNKLFYYLIVTLICLSCFRKTEAQTFHPPKVVAHRGAWLNTGVPQNSMASLTNAIKLGCDGSEFDVRMTKDGVLIINHDADYVGIDIESSTYNDLLKVPLANGENIPKLSDFISLGKTQEKTTLFIEIKPSPAGKSRSLFVAQKIVEMVQQMDAQKLVVYISFDYDVLKKVHELDTNAKTQLLKEGVGISPSQLKADGITGTVYQYNVYFKDEKLLLDAQKIGLTTNSWTVNDPFMMDYFFIRNIDYLLTDEPEKAYKKIDIYKKSPWTLVWSDEFNYVGLPDSTKWNYDVGGDGWGNNELQFYTKADTNNAIVKNGFLSIKAKKEKYQTNEYTSARLVTRGKADWNNGRVEIRAKLPKVRGTSSAVWMLGTNFDKVGLPQCGEVKIFEQVGYAPDTIAGSLQTDVFNQLQGTQKIKRQFVNNATGVFHIYAVEWDTEKINFLLDEKVYFTVLNDQNSAKDWSLNNPMYILLNLAVGGDWGGAKGIDNSIFPAQMQVDYVRVFFKPCPPSLNLSSFNNPSDDISNGTIVKQTNVNNGFIIANNHITGSANVTYQAGSSVLLNPGFKADIGTVFKAQMGGCQ
ncbi:glycerophosphodiester phosphodiesterase family protein [Emticicia sp. SJ17W-69]|uniref:glycerophosphodiester phosphodiesterase family protein n=1 Tax=Emticicia sp. SJ17W-69 TaxID=3421657 RepID=UPI003EB8D311